jgi:glutaredoxin-related protein
MKPNIFLFAILLVILILIGGVFINFVKDENGGGTQDLTPPIIHEYFWSETCPHCANVAEFMETWEGKDKVQIEKLEVSRSTENAQKFIARGLLCKIPRNQLGVPLLVTPNGECSIGDVPVIDYLKSLEL